MIKYEVILKENNDDNGGKNMQDKETVLKEILNIRRKRTIPKDTGIREIEIFEEQVEKSLRRIEQTKYLAKKFNIEELMAIHKAYEDVSKS